MVRRSILIILALISTTAFSGSLEDGTELFNSGTAFYQNGDYKSAYETLKESITQFKMVENEVADEWLLNSFLWSGAAAYNLGYFDESESYYLKSLKLAEYHESIQYQSNIVTALANLKFSLAEYSEAGNWYIKSSKLLKTLDSIPESTWALEYGGYSKVLAKEYSLAYEIYEEIIENYSSSKQDNEIANLYSMSGNCLYYMMDLEGALSYYQHATSLLEQYGSSIPLSQFYGWLGKIYFDSSENENALRYFKQSLNMAKELNSQEDESRILGYLGFLYASIGEYTNGVNYYKKSLEVAINIGQAQFIVAAYESLAWIYGLSKDEDEIIEIKKRLIELFKQTNDEPKLVQNFNDLGYIFYERELYKESIPLFESSVNLLRKAPDNETLKTVLINLGMSYEKIGNKALSEKYLNESLSISLNEGDTSGAEDILGHFNLIYSNDSDYYSLIDSLKRFIPIYKLEKDYKKLLHVTNNIGVAYYEIDEYNKAIKYYTDAKILATQLEDYEELSISLHNIAQSKAKLALFDEALEINEQALDIATKHGLLDIEANLWNSLGELYRAWGWYEKSLTCYNNAFVIFEQENNIEGIATINNNIGQALRGSGQAQASIPYYIDALELSIKVNDKKLQAITLSNLGEAYRDNNENDKAMEYYSKALQTDIEIKNLEGIHIRKNNIALLDLISGDYIKARDTFEVGLKYWQKIGDRREESIALKNLWAVNFQMDKYETAAEYLVEVVRIQEQLRLTAKGAIRREYLDSQIESYRDLAATYYYMKDPLNALYFMELSRGKYLLEQMNITNDSVYDWSTYTDFIQNMKQGSALLTYSVTDKNLIQAISIENDRVSTTLINIEEQFLDSIYDDFGSLINRYVDGSTNNQFETILKFYRILLSRPIQSRSTTKAINDIGGYLYSKLITPFHDNLKGINQLIIVPDGILGTIPFEVLTDENSKYLIERYDISYSQSLVISQIINNREYKEDRNPMLAFGGAIYEDNINVVSSDKIVDRQEILEMIRSGRDTRKAYNGMGLGSWQDLPGTLEEVKKLSEIVPKSKIITGADVTEETVFNISNSGDLANYKVIHFATHGIVVPEIPELSAVVLSQTSNNSGENDGYLTMSEIASLKIKADFVNLSACETGLGKIYQGEGVVGLTQAFLIAGANALSVSLWQVSDESTMKFMTGVYTLVEEQGFSYSGAISEMKRVFLKDDLYKNPFYWAPFVLYGDYEAGL